MELPTSSSITILHATVPGAVSMLIDRVDYFNKVIISRVGLELLLFFTESGLRIFFIFIFLRISGLRT